ncbi:MAG: hypothetical protein WBE08_03365 [Methyloceanibacter sp.]|jgi:hypothetical protein
MMLQLLSKRAVLAVFAFPAIILGGCSDSFGTGPSAPTFKTSAKGYEKTLTPDQQKALIADLRGEQAKRGETPQDTTASVKPAN